MEKIEIKDMVTLRALAMKYAIELDNRNMSIVHQVSVASSIESYIKGNAELPEYDSPKNSMWISADDKMKPALDTQVLVMCADSEYPLFGEYLGEDYWEVADADVIHYTKDGEVTVVAWLPIPEYKPKEE